MRRLLLAAAVVGSLCAGVAFAATTVEVRATLETEPFLDARDEDADDPAIWVHPKDSDKSVVVGTLKNGGLAVFDLKARTIQRIDYTDEDARQNNVDLLYDVELGGRTRDLAVVTDRGLDHVRVFAVDPRGTGATSPLQEVTIPDPPVVFEGDDDISAYGIAAWKGKGGTPYVVVSQRHRTTLVLLRLVAGAGGTVGWKRVDELVLPSSFAIGGKTTWTPCVEEDGELPQVEGMVVDAKRGLLYAGQEDVGFWRISVANGRFGATKLFDRVREFGQSYARTYDPAEEEYVCEVDAGSPSAGSPYLAADAEGVTIYPRRGGKGYLLASSQGSSTFIVYDLPSLRTLGTFAIAEGPTDAVDESDGAMVVPSRLDDRFAKGLLVTHDGDAEPDEDATNFKFTRWQDVAKPLGLEIDTTGDPREP